MKSLAPTFLRTAGNAVSVNDVRYLIVLTSFLTKLTI